MLKRIISYAHELMAATIEPGETVVDGTCGNGKDTLILSKLVGESGSVLAFDIQSQAINNTRTLLVTEGINNVRLIQDDHQHLAKYVEQELHGKIGGAIFNLGYLPGSDKKVITTSTSTIKAIDTLSEYIKSGGLIILVVYHGHPGGEVERDALLEHLKKYEQKQFNVLQYGFINQRNSPPFILAIEKKYV
ncbi:class I SAM-dependent methyltransferase [Aquibacillus rhizosphaerae]|uniref:Class I SAM-dependent methyltransferase n=1 Tax=Aquibacillus rhizosphaerae TaxID=3051431 RepID=A0ABT7L9M9_9BACI|nr:class I SAM-dependent methyltransferase [Aquibacillus sp. LR5S19]MDL4842578.1 class I SAM-dependent methyltransferase [Aquibacillus sp. LR5S19]